MRSSVAIAAVGAMLCWPALAGAQYRDVIVVPSAPPQGYRDVIVVPSAPPQGYRDVIIVASPPLRDYRDVNPSQLSAPRAALVEQAIELRKGNPDHR